MFSSSAPNTEKQFIVQTDASERGVGVVLSQLDESGADHPVAYFSRKLLLRKQRYSTVEVSGYQAWHTSLGRPFTVQMDHRTLQWLDRVKERQCLTHTVEFIPLAIPI